MHRLLYAFTIILSVMASSHAFTSNSQRVLKGASPVYIQISQSTQLKATKKADAEEVVNFKKADFVAAVAEKTGMTKGESEKALSAVLNVIATEVASGKKVSLPGFGTFKLSHRAARKGRNPKTGEPMDIKASNTPSFSASKTFKDMANPNR